MTRLSILAVLAATAAGADGFKPAVTPVAATGRVELPTLIVRPRLTGVVAKVLVKEGQDVKKGDVLAELDDKLVKLELDVAEAKLKQAEVEAAFAKDDLDRLKKGGGASQQEQDRAKALADVKEAEATVAKASVKKAQLGWEGMKVVCPADGRVDRVLLTAGTLVRGDQDGLVRLTPSADPVVVFTVGEADYQKLREVALGDKGTLTAAAGFVGDKGHPHPLALLPNPVFHEETKTVTVRATLATPKDGLAQGEPVRVQLGVGK